MDIFTSSKGKAPGVDSPDNLDELLAATDSKLGTDEAALRNRGFQAAGKSDAAPQALTVNLTMLHQEHVSRLGTRAAEYRGKIAELTEANEPLIRQVALIENEEIQSRQEQIQQLKDEIDEIPGNPKKYELENDEFSQFEFAISSLFLIFLTLYLIVFYVSTSYSAFFRNAAQDLQALQQNGDMSVLFSNVFDPKAFLHAREQGGLTLPLVLLIPFVFLSLGYMIHKAFQRKNMLMATALTLGAFGFDALLAGKITYNLYDLKLKTGVATEPWHTSQLLSDIDFWIVLAAGFLVYILWGLMVNSVAEQAKNSQPIQAAIRRRKRKIDQLTAEIQQWREKLEELRTKLDANLALIKKLESSLSQKTIMWSEFEGEIAQFTKGWLEFISGTQMRVKERQDEATDLVKEYLQQVQKQLKPSAL
ncbi:hypothetical protein ACFST9_01805 [Hymenobacter monticola]|uniref:Small-conductance mechanosensitive channel n=1 Tax=Hymenobacter monticola TaxID=1705399 RepID=A0ABY4B2E0_9BACT|nr:hypothetical protein [Hymenobacter monticola]UOE33303.1 hypothetical protein MTP16_19525 [Hymenobacter monticola]